MKGAEYARVWGKVLKVGGGEGEKDEEELRSGVPSISLIVYDGGGGGRSGGGERAFVVVVSGMVLRRVFVVLRGVVFEKERKNLGRKEGWGED